LSSTFWGLISGKETDLTARQNDQTGSGTHPLSCFMNAGISFPEGKAYGREADRLPSSNAEYKNVWSYTSVSLIRFPVTKTRGRLVQINSHLFSELHIARTNM
jgi:hypothetical protein